MERCSISLGDEGYCNTHRQAVRSCINELYNKLIEQEQLIPVLQDWVCKLTFMQQSVLIASVRGPDGIKKDHPVKVLCRWLRRSFMICAFDRVPHNDPYEPCGGSFTGKCKTDNVVGIEQALDLYMRSVDELPHHFQLHFLHAAEILGYKHPNPAIRTWWNITYKRLVNDAHLYPESEEQMDTRLGDSEAQWRAREEVTAL